MISVLSQEEISVNENGKLEYFTRPTTDVLRGLAVILLLVGHLSGHVIEGDQPLDHAGRIAVIIFLYLSAVGLTKTYCFAPCRWSFLYRRVRKLIIPLWLSAVLFYCLDGYFLGKTYPWLEVLLSFVIGSQQPSNPPTWFVSYILFLYVVFFLCSQIIGPLWLKVMAMMAVIGADVAILDRIPVLAKYFSSPHTYITVFPLSVAVAFYGGRYFDRLCRFSGRQSAAKIIGFLLPVTALIYLASDRLKTPQIIILLTLFVFWFDSHEYRIRVLSWLGAISYEIYLLHFPLMVSYGLVAGHKYVWFHFAGYCMVLIPASYAFNRGCAFLTDRLLPINRAQIKL